MADVDITELDELQAKAVSGVATPANGTPFLFIKAAAAEGADADEEETDDKDESWREKIKKSDSAEADDFEEEVTKEGEVTSKALTAAERKEMPSKAFAFVDENGGKHLPVHDKAHTKAALSQFSKTDFTGATKPVAAKAKAAAKIKAAAEQHGIEVSDDHPVAGAAKKGAVQDGLNGTATPQEAGHLSTAQSSAPGSEQKIQTGTRPGPSSSSTTLGGATTAEIPDVTKVDHGSPVPDSTDAAGVVHVAAKGVAVATLVDAMDAISAQREAIKEGKFLQVENPTGGEPGSMPWESYDSCTLAQVAQCLAGCCNALDSIKRREAIEVASGEGCQSDLWALEDVTYALDTAMGVAARLAFQEAAEGVTAEDAVKNLDVEKLDGVRKSLGEITELNKAVTGPDTEETIHVADVTKSELAEAIVAGVEKAFVERDERKKAKKAEKEAEAAEAAKESANNDGELSESEIKPTKEVSADDINAVKSGEAESDTAPEPVSKEISDALTEIKKGLEAVEETVSKIAKRPRPGGPSLDGQARGVAPAAEGRQSEVTKGTDDAEIERLTKALETETDPAAKGELGLQLTRLRLTRMHETGQL